jgi:hypothetical protein
MNQSAVAEFLKAELEKVPLEDFIRPAVARR